MKTFFKIRFAALFLALTTGFVSCDKDEEKAPDIVAPKTIVALAQATPNLSILVQALTKAGLVETLSQPGTYTVFAPTNDAFAALLKAKNFASLDAVPTEVLKQILLNHVISATKKSTDLFTGYVKTLAKSASSGTNTMSMYVDIDTKPMVKLNGVSKVVTPDVLASNGVVHIVDSVIDLPTIVTHATANKSFSTLASVLTGQSLILGVLSGDTSLTVFAPNNDAFSELLSDQSAALLIADNAKLTKILQYHVVSGNILSSSLTDGQTVPTLLVPQKFTVKLPGGARIKDATGRECSIVATDVQCSNGVIHALGKVLLPVL